MPVVRRAVVADLAAIVAVVEESPGAPQWGAAEFAGMFASVEEAALQRLVLVALVDGGVAGVAVYTLLETVFPPEAELESLAVSPLYRRRGVAMMLLRSMQGAMADAGAETVVLEVRAGNVGALALYRRAGFDAVGSRRAYYAAPVEDAVLMERALGGSEVDGGKRVAAVGLGEAG